MEVPGIAAVFLEVFPEVQDEIINSTGGGINVVAPYGLKNFLPWYHFVFVFDEQFQEHRFLFAQLYFLPVKTGSFLRFKINLVIAEFILVAQGGFILKLPCFY